MDSSDPNTSMRIVPNDERWAVITTLANKAQGGSGKVAAFLFEHGANVEFSSSTVLGDACGGHTLFSAAPETMARIEAAYAESLADLSPSLLPTSMPEEENGRDVYDLAVYAFDQAGIVSRTTRLLESLHVDVVGMAGCTYSAPQAGTPLFVLEMQVRIPGELALLELCREVDELADRCGWDVDLRPSAGAGAWRPSFPPSSLKHITARTG
jgi:glycine cleavage system regulatory protein